VAAVSTKAVGPQVKASGFSAGGQAVSANIVRSILRP
jgi:hypothetical protein